MARGPGRPPSTDAGEPLTIPLFDSAHDGYGDGYAIRPNRYNRVLYGFDTRVPGELRFADLISTLAYENAITRPPLFCMEWRNAEGAGVERQTTTAFISNTTFGQILYGVVTNVASSSPAARAACVHDAGDGIAYRYLSYGNGGTMERQAIDGSVSTSGAGANFEHDKLASISGALYGSSRPTGGTRWTSVQFVPFGSNPFTSGNWSAVTRVGSPQHDINNIIEVRGVPVVLKPEGIFTYNRSLNQWENMLPAWEANPHPDNGRAAVSLGPYAVISMGQGGCLRFDGYTVQDVSPYLDAVPDIDTTSQKISAMGVYGGEIIAVTSVSHGQYGGSGSKESHVFGGGLPFNQKALAVGNDTTEGVRFWRTTDNEVTFTNGATNAGDESLATVVSLNSQDTAANGDYFVIGHRYPWRACIIEFDIGATAVNTAAATLTAEYWNGSAWTSIAIQDYTLHFNGTTSATLGQSGTIVLTDNPTDWAARTYGTGGTDTAAGYFYIRFSVSAALSATVSVANVRFIPWRPAIDTTNHAIDGQDRSGVLPHILIGKPDGEGITWHDMGSLGAVDEIGSIMVGHIGGNLGSHARKIVCFGRRQIYLYHISESNMWPFLSARGLYESGAFNPLDGRMVALQEVSVRGRDFDGVGNLIFYYRYDPHERWSAVSLGARPPCVSRVSSGSRGTAFQWAIGYVMSDTSNPHAQRRPIITGIEATFLALPTPADQTPQRLIATTNRG